MAEKNLNHYIPRSILKYWVTKNEEGREGVYTLDIKKGKKYFSSSTGKKAFSFAIGKELYIPTINNKRRLELEDWFGGLESSLASAIRRIQKEENKPLFNSSEEMVKFIMALFTFKHRSQFVIEKNKKLLKYNPDLRNQISGGTDREGDLVILENIVNATTSDTINLSNFEMLIMKSKYTNLIYGDMPFLENIVDGFNFLPLTKNIFIAFRKTNGPSFYNRINCEDGMAESMNSAIASNSVNWIIADNPGQIEKYENLLKENIDVDSEFVPLEFPMQGFLFKDKTKTN